MVTAIDDHARLRRSHFSRPQRARPRFGLRFREHGWPQAWRIFTHPQVYRSRRTYCPCSEVIYPPFSFDFYTVKSNRHRILRLLWPLIAVGLAVLFCVEAGFGQEELPADLALAEKDAALNAAIVRVKKVEEELAESRSRVSGLTEALSAANAESRQFSKDYQRLRMRVEALGPELLEKGDTGITARLLSAVSDLGLARKNNQYLADQLLHLSEAIVAHLSNSGEKLVVETRSKLEAELRKTELVLGAQMNLTPQSRARHLEAARVRSFEKDLGLIVIDAGIASNVKVGTPIEITRGGRPVAYATVVDVRDSISGAIITSDPISGDLVKIGDGIRINVDNDLEN
jgi:hypothetical protein